MLLLAVTGISTALVGVKAAVTISQLLHKGCSQDFSKGGYTVSNRGYSLDCHVDLHAMFILMLQIKKLTKGGYRQPRIPLAMPLDQHHTDKPITQNIYITNKWNTTT